EIVIDGTLLYVLGYASVKKAEGPTLTEQKIEALRELKQNPQNLQQFDSDGDGEISADEWDAARAAVEEKVMRESLQNKQQRKKQEEHIIIGKKKGHPLIITETHSEDGLTTRYLYYSIPLFLAAAVATGGAIYLLLNYIK
ncbi:MAG: EF-hand domain-containing protein, partial [Desulfuromusa sp.]|nr:EF-hand domain-containing protein [Desulfuromusa sp.]